MSMTYLSAMIESYRAQYGEHTEALFAAMLAPQEKVALINPFLSTQHRGTLISEGRRHESLGDNFYYLSSPPQIIDGLLSHYFLDTSSVCSAQALPLLPGQRVLDMASAPGGKLVVMLNRQIADVEFVANDLSPARVSRLRNVVDEFLPSEERARVSITNKDASYFGLRRPGEFDAVFLDAPCSSEAHVASKPELAKKFRGLNKNLPYRQYAMLTAALLAVKHHGYVMYATCSINQHENDDVIDKLLKKKSGHVEVVDVACTMGTKTKHGIAILPHVHNAGPAYYALLKRKII